MIIITSVGLPQQHVTRYSLRTRAVDFVLSRDSNQWVHIHTYVAGWFVHFDTGPLMLGFLN